jgi:hypothetical protein
MSHQVARSSIAEFLIFLLYSGKCIPSWRYNRLEHYRMKNLNSCNTRRHISSLKGQGSVLLGLSLLVANLAFANTVLAAIIGVDLEAGQGSPTNWNSYTLGDVDSTKTGLIAEDGSVTSLAFTLSGVDTPFNAAPNSNTIPTHSNDLTKVCCDILYSSTAGTATATWSGLTPLATYNYWFITSASAIQLITVTGNTGDSFSTPNLSPLNIQAINDTEGSNTSTFASYARQIQASVEGEIEILIGPATTPVASGFALELAPVPIPAAAWLFGSGLLGLIGIARRKKV